MANINMRDLLEALEKVQLTERNMSYCRFQNTLGDLRDCVNVLEALSSGDAEYALSDEEKEAARSLIMLCKQIAEVDEGVLDVEPEQEPEVAEESPDLAFDRKFHPNLPPTKS